MTALDDLVKLSELDLSQMRIWCWQDPGKQCYSRCPGYDQDCKVCCRKRGDAAKLSKALGIVLEVKS